MSSVYKSTYKLPKTCRFGQEGLPVDAKYVDLFRRYRVLLNLLVIPKFGIVLKWIIQRACYFAYRLLTVTKVMSNNGVQKTARG